MAGCSPQGVEHSLGVAGNPAGRSAPEETPRRGTDPGAPAPPGPAKHAPFGTRGDAPARHRPQSPRSARR